MSATFVKPENALKRAEELIEVGKMDDALDTLHGALLHRRFKNQWSPVLEEIMEKHLGLCVELKKIRVAREGLHQYRSTCQAANITSLEKVVRVFRLAAEDKVNEAMKEQDLKGKDISDLDELDSPETILLQAIQAGDTRQQSQDKDVHTHFRFLWDSYKVILDVLKSNNRLEEVYHETSKHAFEFCKVNSRPQEFKRLCDILRKNYQDLFKRTGSGPQNAVQPGNPDTITKTLETRCRQMQVATELDLWREAYFTATEICELMAKTRPKPPLRSMYYEYLGQIFWKSENYLFHAFASLKNVMYVKATKQNCAKQELELLASRSVLATLCVPFQKNMDTQALEMSNESASQNYEKAKKYASLFSAQSVPSRDSISSQIIEKGLRNFASEPCKKLFDLVESDFTPLSLCQDAKPFLDQIATDDICEGKLKDYVTPLKQIIFFRLMKQLSEVYISMTIEDFERAASIVPFNIAEKWMANAARAQGISIQINYIQQAIVFGAPRKLDMKSMRQPLIEIGFKLQQAMQRVAADELQKKDKLEKAHLLTNIRERMDKETKTIRQRKEEIERRKEEFERKKQIQEKEANEKLRKQEAAEAEQERLRQEVERQRRAVDREEQKRKEAEIAKNKEMLEQMKKLADQKSNLKVAGKKITDIEEEDLDNISFDQIEKAREAQITRERQDKIRARKMENKRVDHLARALREEETPLIDDWADEIEASDAILLGEAEKRNEGEQRAKHEKDVLEKTVLLAYQSAKDTWASSRLDDRTEEFEAKRDSQTRRLTQKVVDNKIARAKERMLADQKDREERDAAEQQAYETEKKEKEDNRRRQAEEEREAEERIEREERQREEEESRREEKERAQEARREEDERRQRADEKRRVKEQEMEDRAQQPKQERAAPADKAPGGGAGAWRRGDLAPAAAPAAAKEEEGSWRRPAPAAREEAPRPAAAATRSEDSGSWRAAPRAAPGPAAAAPAEAAGAWRRPAAAAGAAASNAPAASDKAAPWRPNRDRPAAEPVGRERQEEAPRRAPAEAAAPAPRAAAAAPAPDAEEDDGFAVVAGGKKKGGAKAAGGGDAGDRRPTPPWKRTKP